MNIYIYGPPNKQNPQLTVQFRLQEHFRLGVYCLISATMFDYKIL